MLWRRCEGSVRGLGTALGVRTDEVSGAAERTTPGGHRGLVRRSGRRPAKRPRSDRDRPCVLSPSLDAKSTAEEVRTAPPCLSEWRTPTDCICACAVGYTSATNTTLVQVVVWQMPGDDPLARARSGSLSTADLTYRRQKGEARIARAHDKLCGGNAVRTRVEVDKCSRRFGGQSLDVRD